MSSVGPLWVVVKFAENGCLLDYVRKHKKQDYEDYINTAEKAANDESKGLSYVEKLRLAYGISKGMNHLAKVKVRKRFIFFRFSCSQGPGIEVHARLTLLVTCLCRRSRHLGRI